MPRTKRVTRDKFSKGEKAGLYKAIFSRRDVRSQFKPRPIPEVILAKILNAAHHAGSVGFMQPWNFILIKDKRIKQRIRTVFEKANHDAAGVYEGAKRKQYLSMKLEGIMEAPLNICVTCDPSRGGPHVLGRHTIPETDLYSTCCAIQNLWLAARAEGIGMGWVSILRNDDLRKILRIPAHIIPVAYLCLGYVTRFLEKPELELSGWRKREPLSKLIYFERWGKHTKSAWASLDLHRNRRSEKKIF
jgi:5,6-dimethylbenzimidazole synthase